MDIDELSTYLRLEKQTLYNWLNKKKISGIKLGHVWRFEKKDIDNWLRSQTVAANPKVKTKKETKKDVDGAS
jgi:excisionase family DNA binding protein